MTEQEIDVLPAGRELDALVAERVMGWVWRHRIGDSPGCTWLFPPDAKERQVGDRDGYRYITCFGIVGPFEPANGPTQDWQRREQRTPEYSTDITAAWEVVEKLKRVTLYSPGAFTDEGLLADADFWTVDFYDEIGLKRDANSDSGYGETAPLAISRAALKAVAYGEAAE